MQSSKMTRWNRSTLWMGSRYKNMTQTVWNRILSCSRRKTAKKHTIYEKNINRIYLYMWEVSYTNKRYIYIYTSYYYSHPIVNPQKIVASNSRIQRSTASHGQQGGSTCRFGPSRSLYLGEPTWISGSIDMSPGGVTSGSQPPLKTKVVPFKRW